MAALYLCTYDRGKDLHGKTKAYHWALFLGTDLTNSSSGTVHQLRGMPGGFSYPGAEAVADIASFGPGQMEEMLEIGSVPAQCLGEVEGLLKRVEVVKDESSDWNCQNWTKDGISVLKEKGWVYLEVEAVKEWVREKGV